MKFGETLTAEQRQYAYQLGVMDRALNSSGQKSSDEVLQNGTESDKIKENAQEGAQNEQGEEESGVHLRGGSERDGGQDPGGQVSSVEGGTRQDQSGREAQRRPADAAAASGLDLGEEVSAKSFEIKGGIDSAKVKRVKEGSESPAMKQAREMAEARGLKVTFFAGGNLKIRINGKIASVRGYIEGDRVFIRVDHPKYTADQLMRHEICHDMIDNGEIDINEVRERIKALGVDVEYFIDRYSEAYALSGAIMGPEDVWVEIICDSYGDMNEFASVAEFGKMNAGFLSSLKGEVEASRKDARGPPKSSEGRASRDPQKGRSLEIETMENNRFERLREYRDNLPNMWFAYTDKIFYVYINKSYTDYTITKKIDLTEQNIELIKTIEGTLKNEAYRDTTTFSDWLKSFRSGERSYSWDNANASERGATRRNDGVDGRARGGEAGNITSNSGENIQRYKIDKETNLPIVETFTDVSGQNRKVLKFPNGQYVVKDTQKHNRMFSSIDQAISAENENIIQRYARKNNRSVTWVKNKLAEDSDFLAKERRKGKASQDLDFFYYLNENAEDAEITESETIEERELSNREFLANALESVVKTEADKKTLRQYKRRAKALDAMEAELKDLNAKIRELSFATGPRDKVTLTKLKEQKAELEKKIHTKDKALLMEIENTAGQSEYYAVRSMVKERVNLNPLLVEINIVGKLSSVNAKKIGSPAAQVGKKTTTPAGGITYFTYSIADFLQDVKGVFDDTFSNDVYAHFNMQRNANDFSANLMFSDRDPDALTNREILANLLESEDMSPSEKGFLTKYKNKLSTIEAAEAEIAKMEAELKDLKKNGKKD